MSINYIYKYPLDLTGQHPDNFISGDLYTLQPGVNRVIVPRDGAFYTNGLVVRDASTGEVLTPNDQYVAVMYYREPSERSGLEVMTAIVITDGNVSSEVSVDLHLVGGIYSNIGPTISLLIAEMNLDNREVRWGDILGKPHAFNPAHHLHDIGDVYGFEYIVEALDRIANAILYGNQAAFDELRQYVDVRDDYVLSQIGAAESGLADHLADHNNPHNTTKVHVGLGSVQNYAMATVADMTAAVLQANKYVSPANFRHYFEDGAGKPLIDHLTNYNNPHNTTKAQVGLGSVQNYPMAVNADMNLANLPSDRYVSPALLHRYMTHGAGKPLNDHIGNMNNPHNTTKAHVGLGNVPNVDMSNIANATSGILPLARGGTGRSDGRSPRLVSQRTIAINGDASWQVDFHGGANVSAPLTLNKFAKPIPVSSNVTATVNATHHITSNSTITLPNTSGLAVNDSFVFSKESNRTPTIRVQNTSNHQMTYLGNSDTHLSFDDDCVIIIIYRGGNNFTVVRY